MKIRFITILVIAMFFSVSLFPVTTIKLKGDDGYLEKLLDNNIYLKRIWDIDHENGNLYFLDRKYSKVFKVDFKTGKLIKTLFRRGQGPSELMIPASFKVKNNKVFVLDQGFNGIKIMDVNGKFVNEFKIRGMVGMRNLDVNDKGEIFVATYDSTAGTYISVYDMKGNLLRSLIKLGNDTGKRLRLERIHYRVGLDNKGNIILLFLVTRELKKFDANGKLLWATKVNNKILEPFVGKDDVKAVSGTIRTNWSVFDLNVMDNNHIMVGHANGGCLYNPEGVLTHLLLLDPLANLGLFDIVGDQLVNVLVWGRVIYVYDFKFKENVK
ncbi:MAG: hypothetical protein GY940_06125 [bacterium]|nr:hypothetical protein [bacterium]